MTVFQKISVTVGKMISFTGSFNGRLHILLLLAIFLFTLATGSAAAQSALRGDFEPFGPIPAPGSQAKVKFEEFFNFTCPHCNNFRNAAKPLFKKYEGKLDHQYLPVLFRGQSDEPLRLYFIAEKLGRGAEVRSLIYDATFKYGVNINDPAIVNYLAKSAGLGVEYASDARKPWVDEKIMHAQRRAALASVNATPTVVLADTLRVLPRGGADQFVNNLDQLIQQLLK